MRIRMVTTVKAPFDVVSGNFDRNLFEYLLPPVFPAVIRRYEGHMPGDIIDVLLKLPFGKHWTLITKETWKTAKEYGFAERGLRTPLGITYWHHTHRVVARNQNSSFIIDEIEFETSLYLTDYTHYVFLFGVLYYHKLMYSRYFKKFGPKLIPPFL